MQVIFKYPLSVADRQILQIPTGYIILSVQVQNDTPCLWVLLDSEAVHKEVAIVTVGTGHGVTCNVDKFIGTYQLNEGSLVFHVFEEDSI